MIWSTVSHRNDYSEINNLPGSIASERLPTAAPDSEKPQSKRGRKRLDQSDCPPKRNYPVPPPTGDPVGDEKKQRARLSTRQCRERLKQKVRAAPF